MKNRTGEAGMGDRGLPSGAEAVLRGRKGTGEESSGYPQASFALPAGFLRLEMYRLRTGVSWYEAEIIRDAIRAYLAHPAYELTSTA